MPSAVLTTLVLAQLVSPARRAELTAAASASPRPPLCAVDGSRRGSSGQTLWDRARRPGLGGYCSALARGYGELRADPAGALEQARAADRALGRPAAAVLVLQGRALLGVGRPEAAFEALVQARKLDRSSLEAPESLHALGLSAAAMGLGHEARAAYRRLVPQAGLLADADERQRVYVEAAAWALDDTADGLDEAIGYLGEARRQSASPGYRPFVLGVLALALELQGQSDQSRGVAAEAGGPEGLLGYVPAPDDDPRGEVGPPRRPAAATVPVLPAPLLHAMVAVLAGREERSLADEHWRRFRHLVAEPTARYGKQLAERVEAVAARGRPR